MSVADTGGINVPAGAVRTGRPNSRPSQQPQSRTGYQERKAGTTAVAVRAARFAPKAHKNPQPGSSGKFSAFSTGVWQLNPSGDWRVDGKPEDKTTGSRGRGQSPDLVPYASQRETGQSFLVGMFL